MRILCMLLSFSQTVMPSLHSSGWQRKHLDWEFKLANKESEPDEALVEGIINATESFLRSSEVHRLFIQELVQGTFAEAKDDKLPSKAVRKVIENEIIVMIEGKKEELYVPHVQDNFRVKFTTHPGEKEFQIQVKKKCIIRPNADDGNNCERKFSSV